MTGLARTCLLALPALLIASSACERRPLLQVLDESCRLRKDDRIPRGSPFFDGRTVRLRAARGETLGVTVMLQGNEERQVDLSIRGEAIAVDAFSVRFVEVVEPSTRMYGPSLGPGSYPDVLEPSSQPVAAERRAYFDVAVGRDAAPGTHLGELAVDGRRIPVELRVEQVTIDIEDDPLVWVYYDPDEISRAHQLAETDGPQQLAVEHAYHRLFRRHGAYLAADLRPERFLHRRHFTHGVRYWPVGMDRSSERSIAEDVRAWLAEFADLPVTPFIITVDEPRPGEMRQRARRIADSIARAGGGRPRLLRAVTDEARDEYQESFDLYFSPLNIPQVRQHRREQGELFFTYNGRPPQAGSMVIDTDGLALRTWGWIAFRYDLALWYAWEGLYFTDRYNDGVRTRLPLDVLTFDERPNGGEDFGNGDGLLAYPGPLSSTRLKALRRGLQDRLLLLRLASCGASERAQSIARRVIPTALGDAPRRKPAWPEDPTVFELARHELFDAIAEECAP
jgi:hypothetical protein